MGDPVFAGRVPTKTPRFRKSGAVGRVFQSLDRARVGEVAGKEAGKFRVGEVTGKEAGKFRRLPRGNFRRFCGTAGTTASRLNFRASARKIFFWVFFCCFLVFWLFLGGVFVLFGVFFLFFAR